MEIQLSVATANFYYFPFQETLEIIAGAGFNFIELDPYCQVGDFEMAQHLKGIAPRDVIRWIERSGLQVSSIHDGGGVLIDGLSRAGYINPTLDQYLDALGCSPDYLVFHTPHIFGKAAPGWWERCAPSIVKEIDRYRPYCRTVTFENIPPIEGYSVSITDPNDLASFVTASGMSVTLDVNHYAQQGVDFIAAARILLANLRSIHLSDYANGKTHLFIGEGVFDFPGFFQLLEPLQKEVTITLECSMSTQEKPAQDMTKPELLNRLIEARNRLIEISDRSI